MKTLILTCGTGEGHNSAAKALAERIECGEEFCAVRDPLEFKSAKSAKRTAAIYNGTIKRAPALFGLAYLAGTIYDSTGLTSPVYRSVSKCAEKLNEYIIKEKFDKIICTHLFAMMAVTAVRLRYGLNVSSYGVLTDYTAIPFYRETALDGYFVADGKVKDELLKKKIPESKIYITGIPVKSGFGKSVTKSEAKEKLGLNIDGKIIAVLCGGVGCGKIIKICKKLAVDKNKTVYVFPAKNEKLKKRLENTFKTTPSINIVDFTPDIYLYLKSADVALSKAGGLSSTEAAAANVPLVHLKSIPGCETANRRYFKNKGMALYARSAAGAVKAVERILADGLLSESLKEAQRRTVNACAAEDIIKKVNGE